MIYYKKNLHCVPLDPPSLERVEASVCKVSAIPYWPMIIASVYRSGKQALLESDILSLISMGDSVFLIGDLNCKNVK